MAIPVFWFCVQVSNRLESLHGDHNPVQYIMTGNKQAFLWNVYHLSCIVLNAFTRIIMSRSFYYGIAFTRWSILSGKEASLSQGGAHRFNSSVWSYFGFPLSFSASISFRLGRHQNIRFTYEKLYVFCGMKIVQILNLTRDTHYLILLNKDCN
jgi:hypothetical protein